MSAGTIAERGPMAAPRQPKPRKKVVSNGVLGMLLFVFTEIMLFAGFISAFVIVKSRAVGAVWPPPGQPRLPFEKTAINTSFLILSGVLLLTAHWAFAKGNTKVVSRVALATLLGAVFVALQGAEWIALLGEGLTIRSSSYGAFFYVIIGAHALHAVAALIAMGWALKQLRKDRLSVEAMSTVSIFWYFVVLVWPFLYFRVYL